jgi:DnaJ-class molecular chaperone
MNSLDYCLTCAGTGRKGNLSGKKKCPACQGTKVREVEPTKNGQPLTGRTIVDTKWMEPEK